MKQYHYTINGHPYSVTIRSADEEQAEVEVNGRTYRVALGEEHAPKAAQPRNDTPKAAGQKPAQATTEPAPEPTSTAAPTPKPAAPKGGTGKEVIAPLPGLIREVLVKEGDAVTKGQRLVILEAMKMENEINADSDGTVTALLVAEGDSVQGGDPLVRIG